MDEYVKTLKTPTKRDLDRFENRQGFGAFNDFECQECDNCATITGGDLLYDEESEYLVTPCCNNEAASALHCYDIAPHDQYAEDNESYVYSITGR